MLMVLSLFGCVVVGAVIGWHASLYRGRSRASGLISGAFWGPPAVLIYVFDWAVLRRLMRTSRTVAGLGWAVVVFVSVGGAAAPNTIVQALSTPLPPREVDMACWLDEPEMDNPHQRRNPMPVGGLPESLRQVTTTHSTVLFKLCVGSGGLVERVVVLRSSGRADVDAHYVAALSTWEFPPLEREGRAVRSVVPVAVALLR